MMLTRLSTSTTVDTDAVNPDCLKAAFGVNVDALVSRLEQHGLAADWNTVEVALLARGADTDMVMRVGVLR